MNVQSKRKRIQATADNEPIILVVEDEPDNLLFISHALIFLQYSFITASKGQDALDLASKYDIDLVLLDLILPDMSGFDLISLLKQNKSTHHVPIVVISALVRKNEQDRALGAGCDDYIEKPYFIDDLKQKIRQHLPQSFLNKILPQAPPLATIAFNA